MTEADRRRAPFELPPELAIDTDGCAAHHPRVHPRPAAPGRLRQGPAGALGRHRLGARGLPRGRGHRPGQPAGRADALPDLVARVAGRRRGGRASAGLRQRAGRHQRHGGRLLRGRRAARDATPLRRGNLMARARMMVLYDHSVTWNGLVVGTGNKTETLIGYTTLWGDSASAFNPIGDLYKSQVRQLSAAIGRARRHHPQGALGGPLAGPDGRGGGGLLVRGGRPHPLPARGPPAHPRRGRGRRLRRAGSSSASTAWWRAPSSSARCRPSPRSDRARRASTTSIPRRRPRSDAWLRRRPARRVGRRRHPLRRGHAHRQPRRRHAAGPGGAPDAWRSWRPRTRA